MDKHTPGPWSRSARLNGPWWHISGPQSTERGQGRQAVACVHGESKRGSKFYSEMFEANARLISAAPELLESAKELAAHVREMCRVLCIPEPTASLERYEAAIAKATKEPTHEQ